MKWRMAIVVLVSSLAILMNGSVAADHNHNRVNNKTSPVLETVSDSYITTKIKAKFATDSVVKARSITVKTENGVVSLMGTVNSETEAERAVQMAEGTDG